MTAINDALVEMKSIVQTINVTDGPDSRVWTIPDDIASINNKTYPFVVISKLNAGPYSWDSASFGEGQHKWEILIAVYLANGPIIVTDTNALTVNAITNGDEWYKAMSDILYQNITLNGNAEHIGDGDGKLFDYVTDNIILNGKQHWGHLFVVPIKQLEIQTVDT